MRRTLYAAHLKGTLRLLGREDQQSFGFEKVDEMKYRLVDCDVALEEVAEKLCF